MAEQTETQKASAIAAAAAFSDPAARAKLEMMVKHADNRTHVPDDPAWMSQGGGTVDEYSLFERMTRKLLRVPKSEIDALRKRA